MKTKVRRRMQALLVAAVIVVPAAAVCLSVFFGIVAPKLKAAERTRTALSLLARADLPSDGLVLLSDQPSGAFEERRGAWSIPLEAGQPPQFNPGRFAQLQGYERGRAIESLLSDLPSAPSDGLIDAPVWRAVLRLERGTFCVNEPCTVTAAHIGDMLYFEIEAF